MAATAAEVRARAGRKERIKIERPPGGAKRWLGIAFFGPALVFLGALVLYPTLDTIVQSFQSDTTRSFVGLENYRAAAQNDQIITALKNNAIWVATAPAIITGLGLMFAVLTERVRYQTAIKIVVFMPMAISFLATGVIWRLMYIETPDRGFLNAAIGAAADVTGGEGPYPDATILAGVPLEKTKSGGIATTDSFAAGETAELPLTAIAEADVPPDAVQAAAPETGDGEVGAVVWRDFKPGGGEPGVLEEGELGLPGATIELVDADGEVVASEVSTPDGSVVFTGAGDGPFTVQAAPATFAQGFTGITWLAPKLVTPAIIGAFCWMWAGFAVVVIGAGLSALPRDVLEAARVDGANEWQTFRHVTLPLLAPVLGVVFITLVINVLKIFDIIFMAPGASQDEANVIALEMYRSAFTSRRYGLGAVIAVLIFVLVVPVMVLNIRRFRRENA